MEDYIAASDSRAQTIRVRVQVGFNDVIAIRAREPVPTRRPHEDADLPALFSQARREGAANETRGAGDKCPYLPLSS